LSIHSNYCTAFRNEWEDLAFFGDFRFVLERLCSTIVQLLNLRYKSGTTVYSRTIRCVQLEIMNLRLGRWKKKNSVSESAIQPTYIFIFSYSMCFHLWDWTIIVKILNY
jgi:hypothetical protein